MSCKRQYISGWPVAAAIAAALALAGCGGGATTGATADATENAANSGWRQSQNFGGAGAPVRAALLAPLTGAAAGPGDIILKAAQMALFDAGEPRLVLMPRDTASTPQGAAAAARKALEDGADIVLGPLFGPHVGVVADIMQPRGVPVLSFSNDTTRAGGGAIVLGVTPEAEITRILNFAAANGIKRAAAFLPNSGFGLTVAQRLPALAARAGLEMVRISHYPANADPSDPELLKAARSFASYDSRKADLETERARLMQSDDEMSDRALARLEKVDTFGPLPFEAVFLIEPASRVAAVAPLLAYYDVDPKAVQYLGMSNWYDPEMGLEPTMRGAWFTGPEPKFFDQLGERYAQAYGAAPPGRLAALAYDAVAVAAHVAGSAGSDGRINPDALTSSLGFVTYFGPFRINPGGTVERLLAILQVEADGLAVIDPTPAEFDDSTN